MVSWWQQHFLGCYYTYWKGKSLYRYPSRFLLLIITASLRLISTSSTNAPTPKTTDSVSNDITATNMNVIHKASLSVPPTTTSPSASASPSLFSQQDNNSLGSVRIPSPTSPILPLKIMYLVEPSPFTYISGYANRYQETLRYLQQSGNQVEIITADVQTPFDELPTSVFGFPIYHTYGLSLPMYRHVTLSLDVQLRAARQIISFRPHVLHVSTPGVMVFPAILYSRLSGTPLVMSYHTHLPVYVQRYVWKFFTPLAQQLTWCLIRAAHYFADLTLVTSPQIQQEFLEHRVPRVHIWQKGIDTERFHPKHSSPIMRARMTNSSSGSCGRYEAINRTSSDSGGRNNDYLILYVGRLAAEKRVQDLLDVLEHLQPPLPQPLVDDGDDVTITATSTSNTRSNVTLCFVGTGPQEDELKKLFSSPRSRNAAISSSRDRGRNYNVVFMGQLVGDDLSMAYASADVLVLPSDSETLGFVVLESMASGVPVVASRAGGVPSLIEDTVTSFLVTPGSAEEFSEKLKLLWEDCELRSRMGQLARSEAEKWGWASATSFLKTTQYQQALDNYSLRWLVRANRWMQGWRFGGVIK